MNELHRVTFRFGRVTEVHYIDRLPRVGEYVTHGHELWIVVDVDDDPRDTLVLCERPGAGRSRGPALVESSV